MWLGDPNTDPSLKCYCPATGCLKAGVMDLQKCIGIPLVASNPHFQRVDEAYLKMVYGLYPNKVIFVIIVLAKLFIGIKTHLIILKDKHETFIDLDLLTGTVVQARKRLQFSLMIRKLGRFKLMEKYPEALLPLFWIEEGFVLPDKYMKGVKMLQNIVGIVL